MSAHVSQLDGRPWYREPWPWIIIGLLGSVIIASFITLWIAVSNPDAMVVNEAQYQEIKGGLRAQNTETTRPVQEPEQPLAPASPDDGG